MTIFSLFKVEGDKGVDVVFPEVVNHIDTCLFIPAGIKSLHLLKDWDAFLFAIMRYFLQIRAVGSPWIHPKILKCGFKE